VVQQLSEAINFDVPTLNMTLALFLCYPLGLGMHYLPYGNARHVYSFITGLFLLQFTTGVQYIHQVISTMAVYLLILLLPRKTNIIVIPTLAMLYCVLGHLHRQYINYLGWDLDFTGAQMVLTQKLHMMAFNLYDGQCLAGDPAQVPSASKKCAPAALQEIPSLLEYLGYTFCFASVISGPALEFSTYRAACDGSLFFDHGQFKGPVVDHGQPQFPRRLMPTVVPLITSLANLAVFVLLGAYFPILDPDDSQKNVPVILRPSFLQQAWIYRYLYVWVGLFVVRQKYYFAWKNAEGCHNIWYAGFDGYDENKRELGWTTAVNADIFNFETAPNFQSLSKDWNKKTSAWLTKYVYIRTNGNLLAVYGTSAFWHGFYPGYYMFFLSIPAITVCERLAKKKISPYFSQAKWSPYGIVGILTTSFFAEYLVIPFALLAADRSYLAWKSHYFIGHVGAVVGYFVLSALPNPPKDKNAKKVQ
jgi:MBOAT, membrane-bound O-acyltransferase family